MYLDRVADSKLQWLRGMPTSVSPNGHDPDWANELSTAVQAVRCDINVAASSIHVAMVHRLYQFDLWSYLRAEMRGLSLFNSKILRQAEVLSDDTWH